jgi:integrase
MRDGSRVRYSLDEFSWDEASKRLLEINAKEERKDSTVAVAVQDFHDDNERRGLKPSGTKKYKELLNALLQFCEDRAITTIRALDLPVLKKFVGTFTDSSLVQGKKIERLRTFMRYCEDMGWIDSNPAKKIKKPAVKNPPVVPFTADELEAILAAIADYPTNNTLGQDNRARMRAFVLVLRHTGLRISDAVKLSKSQVRKGRLFLHTTKTGAPVHLPLPEELNAALKAVENGSPFYFWTGNSVKGGLTTWDSALRRLFKLAKVENGHAHRFRHTMAIELLNKGVPVELVAAILGNSPAIVYKHYAPWVRSRQDALDSAIKQTWS